MRRRYLLILLVPLLALLALGALPGLIGGGDVYYVTATEVDLEDGDEGVETADGDPLEAGVTETIDTENLSTNRFPYTTDALEDGTSEPYEEGRFGFEEFFTHTPFDEFSELNAWNSQAVAEEEHVAYVEANGTYYRLEITPASEIDADP